MDAGSNIISASNRGLRYGDGCFETMKLINGKIALARLHFERLFTSLEALKFEIPEHLTAKKLLNDVIKLAKNNDCHDLARVRLMVSRGEGGLYDTKDNQPYYIIEAAALDTSANALNENGLVLDVYSQARKVADNFSHIKSNNMLPYVIAALWAKEQNLNEALLMNPYEKIADATTASVFIVAGGIIKTPPLKDGCIDGVMRKHLLQCCSKEGLPVEEASLSVEDVLQAQEVFLTNAVRGIRWVKQAGKSRFPLNVARLLHEKFIRPLTVI